MSTLLSGKEASRVSSRDSSRSSGTGSRLRSAYKKRSSSNLNPLRKQKSKDADSDGTAVPPTPKGFDGVFMQPELGARPKPPAELSEAQKVKLADMLKYFKGLDKFPTSLKPNAETEPPNDWEKLRMLSRESMLRYLRATKWDVAQAKKKLTDTIAWRREFGVDTIDPDYIEPEARCGKETVMGFDNYARPLHYMHPHRNDTPESPRQMQFAVWILECCIDVMPPGVEQLALLINFDKRSRNPTSISNAKLMLYILQNHYVERLGIALCINVPWVFKAFWSAIQGFIDPVTKSKCKFDEGIKEEVPQKQLSSDFGGSLDPQYNHDQYWPELVRLSQQRRKMMLERFKTECNSEIGASEWVIRGGNDAKLGADVPLHKEDVKAIIEEAPDKAALADPVATDDKAGANVPILPVDPDAASPRQDAIAKCEERVAVAKVDPTADVMMTTSGHQDDTDPAVRDETSALTTDSFKTPSEAIATNPLDRTFSKASVAAPMSSLAQMTLSEDSEPTAGLTNKGDATTATTTMHARGQSFKDKDEVEPRPSSEVRDGSAPTKHHQHGFIAAMNKLVHPENRSRPSSSSGHGRGPSSATTTANGTSSSLLSSTSSSSSTPTTQQQQPQAHIKVLFFAAAREAAGCSTLLVPLTTAPTTVAAIPELLRNLAAAESSSSSSSSSRNSVDQQHHHHQHQQHQHQQHQQQSGPGPIKDINRLLSIIERSSWSVGQNMVDGQSLEKVQLKGGEEVAVIPPVSGG